MTTRPAARDEPDRYKWIALPDTTIGARRNAAAGARR